MLLKRRLFVSEQSNRKLKMKTYHYRTRIVALATFLFVAFASAALPAQAGTQSPGYRTTTPVTTKKQADEIKPGETMMLVCSACRTVNTTEYKTILPNGRGPSHWVTVGSKHDCGHCGGTITVTQGKTKDEMGHSCSKCREGGTFCCVVNPETEKK
jgi:hypothetical protein